MSNLTDKYLKENKEIDKLNDKYEYIAEEIGTTMSMCDKFLKDIDQKGKAMKLIKEMDSNSNKFLVGLRNYLKFVDKNVKE